MSKPIISQQTWQSRRQSKFLQIHSLPKRNQDMRDSNKLGTRREAEPVIKRNCLQTKVQDQMATQVNSIKHRKNSYRFFWNSFKRVKRKEYSQRHSMETTIILIQNQRQTLLKKKNDRPISLMNIDSKILNKILNKLTTQKKIIHCWPRWTHLRIITTVQHMQINQWETATSAREKTKTTCSSQRMKKNFIWPNIHSQWKLLWHKDAHSVFIQHSIWSLSHKKM